LTRSGLAEVLRNSDAACVGLLATRGALYLLRSCGRREAWSNSAPSSGGQLGEPMRSCPYFCAQLTLFLCTAVLIFLRCRCKTPWCLKCQGNALSGWPIN